MPEEKRVKWSYRVLLIAGILLVAIGIAFIFLGDYQNAYTESILGLTFILSAFSFKPSIKWKEMPKGMKILIVFLWYKYFSSLWGIYTKFESFDILLGFPLQFPISAIVKPIMLLITLFTLIAIYRRTWWKLILWLQGFTIINFLAGGIWMMITPLSELFYLTGQEAPVAITQQVELLAKSFVLVPMLIGLVIGIIIWIYIFKKKDYFQNQPNINPELIKYIKTEEAQGYTPKQLRNYLIKQGYDSSEVDKAMEYANQQNIYSK
tara:strand:- start:251 stop:1042 length:792 start_codon:yes stop_codon:yes gene_type:complete